MDDYISTNRANWDDRVPVHLSSKQAYNVDAFVADPSMISRTARFDGERLPDLSGKRVIHLMCHLGLDTLSFARLGAEVTGLDFSGESIEVARDAASRAEVDAEFVQSDVYSAREAVEGEFDIVYMSFGVLNWLPDMVRLGGVASSLLKPGGLFHLTEHHPFAMTLNIPSDSDELLIASDYFGTKEPEMKVSEDSYVTGEGKIAHSTTYQWQHSLSDVVTGVISSGLRLTMLQEFQFGVFPTGQPLSRREDGWWHYAKRPEFAPLMFTVQAVRD
ncbi:MAG: class I SAM-dependent methyltransferase [Chloroflexi bacterium]|nr:class I SAM-dependent methyltransferase [Chloroflexota bacterium]